MAIRKNKWIMVICEQCGGQRTTGCLTQSGYWGGYKSAVLFSSDGTAPLCTCTEALIPCSDAQVIPISEEGDMVKDSSFLPRPVCTECAAQNRTPEGIILEPWGTNTCAMWQAYYDVEGRLHSHDPNTYTQEYTCSNGHRFEVKSRKACPACGEVKA